MRIVIDNHSSDANYVQIIKQIKEAIITGELKSDEKLISIRQLASDLNIALITVKRAYDDLIKEGVLYSVQGKGVFVNNIQKSSLQDEKRKEIIYSMRNIIDEAHRNNINDEELILMFKGEIYGNINR